MSLRTHLFLALCLVACGEQKSPESRCDTDCDDPAEDTGDTDDTDDTGDTDDTDDTDETDDTDDTDETGTENPCIETTVTFEHEDGTLEDVTDNLLTGAYLTLDSPGRLLVCPATWYARILVRANVDVVGLGATPADTVLSGGESGTILDVAGPDVVLHVGNVTLDRGVGLDVEHNSGGGGLYCEGFGEVSVEDTVFSHNEANDGAGLYAEDCEVTVTRSTFVDNVSEDDGGALTLWYSNGTFDDVLFSGNVGLDGGAMAMFYSTATMHDATFEDNASGNFAGGLWVYNGTLQMSASSFSRNTNSGGDAGGLLVYGSATLDTVSFDENSAMRGGGLFVYYESDVSGTLCDFSGNVPDDIYAPNYEEEGGTSYAAGAAYSFACDGNYCAEQ